MDFWKKLGKGIVTVLDVIGKPEFYTHSVERPLVYRELSYDSVKADLQEKIDGKYFEVKAETRSGWLAVGRVAMVTAKNIHYFPHKENNYKIVSVEILRNSSGNIVARAVGRWIDSGMSVSGR